jgi:uncharacterized protein YijF (DUF1287 family)
MVAALGLADFRSVASVSAQRDPKGPHAGCLLWRIDGGCSHVGIALRTQRSSFEVNVVILV